MSYKHNIQNLEMSNSQKKVTKTTKEHTRSCLTSSGDKDCSWSTPTALAALSLETETLGAKNAALFAEQQPEKKGNLKTEGGFVLLPLTDVIEEEKCCCWWW